MKIFLDTANVDEIRKAVEMGLCDGVTTNPTLIAKEGRNYHKVLKEISEIVNGPVSAETVSEDAKGMMKEARVFVKINKNIVVKIVNTPEGLKAVRQCVKEKIKTNVTVTFSANQCFLAAKVGATYVSPFIGRLDDIGHDGMQVIRDAVQIFRNYNFKTQILVASIRHPLHVLEAAKIGADIVTVPYNIFEKLFKHPLTDIGIKKFLDDWKKVPKK